MTIYSRLLVLLYIIQLIYCLHNDYRKILAPCLAEEMNALTR